MADKKDSTSKPGDKTQGEAVEKPETADAAKPAKTPGDAPSSPEPETAKQRDPLLMPEETTPEAEGPAPGKPKSDKPAPEKPKSDTPASKPKPAGQEPWKREPAKPEQPPERVVEKRYGFLPALLGGILAALLGFVAGRSDLVNRYLPENLRTEDQTAEIGVLRDEVSAHDSAISALRTDLDGLSIPDQEALDAEIADLANRIDPLAEEVADVTAQLEQIEARIAPMDDRLTELEKQPMSQGVSESAIAAYERELEALQSSVADQRAEMEALVEQARRMEAEARDKEDQAAAAARNAASRTAVAQLRAALDSGRPYGDQVQMLQDNGVTVPDALTATAQDGIATMAALQTDFPPAARSALAAVRAQGPDGSRSFGTFLQRQLGARSVAPRDGSDPDAILSRAEAALTNGDLPRALNEIDSLPDAAKPPLADWRDRAETRLAAIRAADDLAQSLTAN